MEVAQFSLWDFSTTIDDYFCDAYKYIFLERERKNEKSHHRSYFLYPQFVTVLLNTSKND